MWVTKVGQQVGPRQPIEYTGQSCCFSWGPAEPIANRLAVTRELAQIHDAQNRQAAASWSGSGICLWVWRCGAGIHSGASH